MSPPSNVQKFMSKYQEFYEYIYDIDCGDGFTDVY